VDTFANKCTRVNGKQKAQMIRCIRAQIKYTAETFLKFFLKSVTAKLNKIALQGVLAVLKKDKFLFSNEFSFKQKKTVCLNLFLWLRY
jgi:hypothetical protein